MSGHDSPRFLDAGDCGLVVEFGDTIDEAINARVLSLDAALAAVALDGVRETVPTYRSLLINFDPRTLRRRELTREIERLLAEIGPESVARPTRYWRFPVLYGGTHGEDLDAVAAMHEMTTAEVVALHSGADYRVYMIGFMPGFSYLGGLPEAIHTSRRPNPRQKTPPRSVSIGGSQAAVSPPFAIPSAWNMLGQTPVHVYDPSRQERPFLLVSGDHVCFEPIKEADYERLCRAAEAGEIVAELSERGEDLSPWDGPRREQA
jgi:5-oxoprolinase (ATP-hydrolysing) subunit B